jgi:hypothetical protein
MQLISSHVEVSRPSFSCMQNGDVIEDSFEFEFLKSFISQTVDPIDDPFSSLAYSRRDLRN